MIRRRSHTRSEQDSEYVWAGPRAKLKAAFTTSPINGVWRQARSDIPKRRLEVFIVGEGYPQLKGIYAFGEVIKDMEVATHRQFASWRECLPKKRIEMTVTIVRIAIVVAPQGIARVLSAVFWSAADLGAVRAGPSEPTHEGPRRSRLLACSKGLAVSTALGDLVRTVPRVLRDLGSFTGLERDFDGALYRFAEFLGRAATRCRRTEVGDVIQQNLMKRQGAETSEWQEARPGQRDSQFYITLESPPVSMGRTLLWAGIEAAILPKIHRAIRSELTVS